jgi:hypothetical protein
MDQNISVGKEKKRTIRKMMFFVLFEKSMKNIKRGVDPTSPN